MLVIAAINVLFRSVTLGVAYFSLALLRDFSHVCKKRESMSNKGNNKNKVCSLMPANHAFAFSFLAESKLD